MTHLPGHRRLRLHRQQLHPAPAREHPDARVINLDKLTYAGNPGNLRDIEDDEGYRFVQGDICDGRLVEELMAEADYVVQLRRRDPRRPLADGGR